MKFNPTNLKTMREEFKNAVKDLEKKYDIEIKMGNISYQELEFTTKVTFTSKEKESEENERKEFEKWCTLYGLRKEDYGATLKNKGEEFTLIGFEVSRPKFCIRAKSKRDGRITFFPQAITSKLQNFDGESGLTLTVF